MPLPIVTDGGVAFPCHLRRGGKWALAWPMAYTWVHSFYGGTLILSMGVPYSNGIDFPLLSREGVQRGNNLPPKPGLSGPAQLPACLSLVPLVVKRVA